MIGLLLLLGAGGLVLLAKAKAQSLDFTDPKYRPHEKDVRPWIVERDGTLFVKAADREKVYAYLRTKSATSEFTFTTDMIRDIPGSEGRSHEKTVEIVDPRPRTATTLGAMEWVQLAWAYGSVVLISLDRPLLAACAPRMPAGSESARVDALHSAQLYATAQKGRWAILG